MLIHTELEIEEHWGVARRVMELIRATSSCKRIQDLTAIPPNYRRIAALNRIEAPNLITWLDKEMKSWEDSYDSFSNSSR